MTSASQTFPEVPQWLRERGPYFKDKISEDFTSKIINIFILFFSMFVLCKIMILPPQFQVKIDTFGRFSTFIL